MTITPAISAAQLVDAVPSVLSAGGAALDLNGVLLTQSRRPPIGQVLSFPNGAAVNAYFGPTSQEAALAASYFLGFTNRTAVPGAFLAAQYPASAVSAYLRGASGLTLAAVQAVDASLSVTINGTSVTETVDLAGATSLSNAAVLIAEALGIEGPPAGTYTASLATTVMTVSAVLTGVQVAAVTASLSGTTMTVTEVASGAISVGDVVTGTGISAGTTVVSFGTGTGGVGTYTLSAGATTEAAEVVSVFSPTGVLGVGDFVTGTGLTAGTYIASLGTGTGGVGTYNLSASATTESSRRFSTTASSARSLSSRTRPVPARRSATPPAPPPRRCC
jgi:hypothetical protein